MANETVALSVLPAGPLPTTPTATAYIAKTVSGIDGSFSIPAPSSLSPAVLTQVANNNGWLNMQVSAMPNVSSAEGIAGGAALYYGALGIAVLEGPSSVTSQPIGTVRGAISDALNLRVYQIAGNPQPSLPPAPQPSGRAGVSVPCPTCPISLPGQPQPSPGPYCTENWYKINSGTYWEPVGEIHTWQDQWVEFGYSTTASTQVDLGFNFNNSGWAISGNSYIGNTASFSTPLPRQGPNTAREVNAQISFVKEENDACGGPSLRIRPIEWTGGLGLGLSISGDGPSNYYGVDPAYHADYPGGGTAPEKNDGTGYHYSWQVSAFGVALGDQTDWSTNVHTKWFMGTDCSVGLHSLFAYGAPPANVDSQLVFASTESDQVC